MRRQLAILPLICVLSLNGWAQLEVPIIAWARTQFNGYVSEHFLEYGGRRYTKELDPRYDTYLSLIEYKNLRIKDIKTVARRESDDDNGIVWRGTATLYGANWRQVFPGNNRWECYREEAIGFFEIVRYEDNSAKITISGKEFRREFPRKVAKPTEKEVTQALQKAAANNCN